MKGFGLGLIISFLVKCIIKLLNALFTFVAGLVVYFGIWMPGAYMIFSTGLMIWCDLDLKIAGADRNLFFFGLLLSIICAIIISIRNIIVKPIAEYRFYKHAKRELKNCREQSLKKEIDNSVVKNNPHKPHSIDTAKTNLPCKNADNDIPKIYRSKNNPNIIIYEYKEKYDIYREENDNIFKIDSKIKH